LVIISLCAVNPGSQAQQFKHHHWLKDSLEKLPTWPDSLIDELLPLNTAFLDTVKLQQALTINAVGLYAYE